MTASQSGGQIVVTVAPNAVKEVITGRPYSATLTSERTTPDGTRMIQPPRRVYRDSQGRTRTEETRPTVPGADGFLDVEIVDPVAGFSWLVDSENRAAHRVAIKVNSRPAARTKTPCGGPSPVGTSTLPDGVVAVSEPLGAQTVEGAIFCGSKTTSTYPPGSTFHSDRPVRVVNEMWTAWDDGLPFALVRNTMAGGETSVSWIKDVSLSEPAAALFQPPPEYAVVDETGTFAVPLPRVLPPSIKIHQITALTDMPFSAEQAYETRRTDPEGAVLTQHFSLFHFRDAMGRIASGRMVADSSGKQVFRPSLILDVVAGFSYTFDPEATTVRRRPLQSTFKPASKAVPPHQQASNPNTMKNGTVIATDWLGTQAIDGFQTFGRRMTFRYPPGTLGGNDRVFVILDESWDSPELGISLLTKRSHPEAGDSVGTVRNLNFGEPDAALFRVPDGYRLIDDK